MDGYRYIFDSDNGTEYRILLTPQRGWSGNYLDRALGASPILRRERNGCIMGSSLTMYLECEVDNEYTALYTSNAYDWLVVLYASGVEIWRGYVTPETYSAPDMAPPYDVEIIATDGLGELKRSTYDQSEPMSLLDVLRTLLWPAQQTDLPIYWRIDYSSAGLQAQDFLSGANIDICSMSGKTCYDVLTLLLDSLHAVILYDNGSWIVANINDLPVDGSPVRLHIGSSGATVAKSVNVLGGEWWPIGKLSDKVVAAKRDVNIVSEIVLRELMADPNLLNQGGAGQVANGTIVGTGGNDSIVQEVSVRGLYDANPVLKLVLNATGTGALCVRVEGICSEPTTDHDGPWVMGKVEMINEIPSLSIGDGIWVSGEGNLPSDATYQKYASEGGELTINISTPLTSVAVLATDDNYGNTIYSLYDDTQDLVNIDKLRVTVFAASGSLKVTSMSLREAIYYKGVETLVRTSGGARESLGDIDICICAGIETAAYNSLSVLREGVLTSATTGDVLHHWGGDYEYVTFLGIQYAKQYALPAIKKTGTVNVPAKVDDTPALLWLQSGVIYMLNTYDWYLCTDELHITEMVSLISSGVTIESVTITQTGKTDKPTTSSSAGSQGGGADKPYTLPVATSDILGGVKIGAVTTNGQLPLKLDSNNRAYAELSLATSGLMGGIYVGYTATATRVPVRLSSLGDAYVEIPIASSSRRGGIYVGYTATSTRQPVQVDSTGKAYVEIPMAGHATLGGIKTAFSDEADLRAVQVDNDGNAYVDLSGISSGGYIGTTPVQDSATKQDLSGIGKATVDNLVVSDSIQIGKVKLYVSGDYLYIEGTDGNYKHLLVDGDVIALYKEG